MSAVLIQVVIQEIIALITATLAQLPNAQRASQGGIWIQPQNSARRLAQIIVELVAEEVPTAAILATLDSIFQHSLPLILVKLVRLLA